LRPGRRLSEAAVALGSPAPERPTAAGTRADIASSRRCGGAAPADEPPPGRRGDDQRGVALPGKASAAVSRALRMRRVSPPWATSPQPPPPAADDKE